MPVYQNVAMVYASGLTVQQSAETQILDSGRVAVSMPTMRSVVTVLANVSVAASNTTLNGRLHRGPGILGATLLTTTINTTSGWSQDISIVFSEQVLNAESVEYTFSLIQNGAGGPGTANWAVLRVDLING